MKYWLKKYDLFILSVKCNVDFWRLNLILINCRPPSPSVSNTQWQPHSQRARLLFMFDYIFFFQDNQFRDSYIYIAGLILVYYFISYLSFRIVNVIILHQLWNLVNFLVHRGRVNWHAGIRFDFIYVDELQKGPEIGYVSCGRRLLRPAPPPTSPDALIKLRNIKSTIWKTKQPREPPGTSGKIYKATFGIVIFRFIWFIYHFVFCLFAIARRYCIQFLSNIYFI